MVAISDTGPLNYLLLIDCHHVLPRLFERILVPQAVHDELRREGTPDEVRHWAANLPEWMEVCQAEALHDSLLHIGEREAIALIEQRKADMILLDERRARRVAQERGLTVTGTLGILGQAYHRGWIDLEDAFQRLRETSFHIDPKLLQTILEQEMERKRLLES